MTVREIRREEAAQRIADHLIQNGLGSSSLRTLAQAAQTSDRMLLYYFADKDDIIVAALQAIAQNLAMALAGMVDAEAPRAPQSLLLELAPILRGPALRPFMRLWLDLAVLAASGREPYRAAAGAIADGFLVWVAEKLDPQLVEDRMAVAARIVATLDGLVLLDCVGRSDAADLALRHED